MPNSKLQVYLATGMFNSKPKTETIRVIKILMKCFMRESD